MCRLEVETNDEPGGGRVITARLREAPCAPELILECYRLLVQETQREKARVLKQARKRAQAHAQRARLVGHRSGIAQGEKACREKFRNITELLESTYREASRVAQHDILTASSSLVEKIVGDCVTLNPMILERWISQALLQLSTTTTLTLRYHPQYAEPLARFVSSAPSALRLEADPTLHDKDFRIESTSGGIECSWRELLRDQLSIPPTTHE